MMILKKNFLRFVGVLGCAIVPVFASCSAGEISPPPQAKELTNQTKKSTYSAVDGIDAIYQGDYTTDYYPENGHGLSISQTAASMPDYDIKIEGLYTDEPKQLKRKDGVVLGRWSYIYCDEWKCEDNPSGKVGFICVADKKLGSYKAVLGLGWLGAAELVRYVMGGGLVTFQIGGGGIDISEIDQFIGVPGGDTAFKQIRAVRK